MRLPKEIVILVLMTSVLPFARAAILPSDCSHLGGWQQEECKNILADTSLSLGQKEDLYLNLLESQQTLPSHDFAFKWNKKQVFEGPPAGAMPQSSGIIKDAYETDGLIKQLTGLRKHQEEHKTQCQIMTYR